MTKTALLISQPKNHRSLIKSNAGWCCKKTRFPHKYTCCSSTFSDRHSLICLVNNFLCNFVIISFAIQAPYTLDNLQFAWNLSIWRTVCFKQKVNMALQMIRKTTHSYFPSRTYWLIWQRSSQWPMKSLHYQKRSTTLVTRGRLTASKRHSLIVLFLQLRAVDGVNLPTSGKSNILFFPFHLLGPLSIRAQWQCINEHRTLKL